MRSELSIARRSSSRTAIVRKTSDAERVSVNNPMWAVRWRRRMW